MSSVTSFLAASILSLDSALIVLFTTSCTWSPCPPVTSMDPNTLSTSRILCSPFNVNVFWMVSFSCKRMLESSSSSACTTLALLACTGLRLPCARYNTATPKITGHNIFAFNMFPPSVKKSIQLLDTPIRALFHGRIKLRTLLKLPQLRNRIRIMLVYQQIDQRNLHKRRLPALQRIDEFLPNLWPAGITAQSIERRKSHVHAAVIAQGME